MSSEKLDTNPGFQDYGFAGGVYYPTTGLVRFGAHEMCIEATSVAEYRGPHDIFVIGRNNRNIEQVSEMGPTYFIS